MPLYFAYGSNMDVAAMRLRCPRSTMQGRARLPGHRFALTARGFATVARDREGVVHGVLWSLAFADIPALDRWEEISSGLYRKTTHAVVRDGGRPVQALIYVAREPSPPGRKASTAYSVAIVRAAEDAKLPASYISGLAAIAAAHARAGDARP